LKSIGENMKKLLVILINIGMLIQIYAQKRTFFEFSSDNYSYERFKADIDEGGHYKDPEVLEKLLDYICFTNNDNYVELLQIVDFLIEKTDSLRSINVDAVGQLVLYNKHSVIDHILKADIGIIKRESYGWDASTFVEDAYEHVAIESANVLLKYGYRDIDEIEKNSLMIFGCITNKDEQMIMKLISSGKYDINFRNNSKMTILGKILTQMAQMGRIGNITWELNILKVLINEHADLNLQIVDDYRHIKAPPMNILLYNLMIGSVNSYNITSESNRKDFLLALIMIIENGGYISGTDQLGNTPLHIACMLNNYDVVKVLLNNNSKTSPKNLEGKRPIDLATDGKIIKLLKDNGAIE
jgi:hypothetical protein